MKASVEYDAIFAKVMENVHIVMAEKTRSGRNALRVMEKDALVAKVKDGNGLQKDVYFVTITSASSVMERVMQKSLQHACIAMEEENVLVLNVIIEFPS